MSFANSSKKLMNNVCRTAARTSAKTRLWLLGGLVAMATAGSMTAEVSAISGVLPEPSNEGTPVSLVIGRLANLNSLPVPETSAKISFARVDRLTPPIVRIFDGPYCASSNYDLATESANIPCNSTNENGEVYFDFQALDNETGQLDPNVLRVRGSTMTVNGNYEVNLSGLRGLRASTDGRFFVKLRVHWAKQNAPTCTSTSPISAQCQTGSNLFRLASPRAGDLITYAVTNSDPSPLAVQPGNSRVLRDFSDVTFEFAPPCSATAADLNRPLRWQDADYGQPNQIALTIRWDLIDDSAPGGPRVVASRQGAELGGQGEERQHPFTFVQGHKYRWVWYDVDSLNGVQLFLPYDSYNYVRVCPPVVPPPGPPPPPPVDPPVGADDVVTKPYFTVRGGDVSAGPGMNIGGTDCAIPRNDKAGVVSWNRGSAGGFGGAGTQYAAFVLNHLQEFATAQGSGITPTGLSFANTAAGVIDLNVPPGLFGGKFNGGACIPDYFVGATNVQNGDRTLSALPGFPAGGNVANGSRLNYYIDGDLHINSNVRFSGNYASVADIPSFWVVVKGNIIIDRSVAQLDGVYIAQPSNAAAATEGFIYTCDIASSPFAAITLNDLDMGLYDECNNPLTVNGSLTGRQVWLLRSFGDLPGQPAETINYTPEVWLSVRAPGGSTFQITKYDSITSLPPVL